MIDICQFKGYRYELKMSWWKGFYWTVVGDAIGAEPQMFPAPILKKD